MVVVAVRGCIMSATPASLAAAAVAMTCNPGVGGCLVHGSLAQATGRGIMDYASLCSSSLSISPRMCYESYAK